MAKSASKPPRRILRREASSSTALQTGTLVARRDRRQRELFVDPMPDRIEPCLAKLVSQAPASADWAFEIKWDGYRLAVHLADGKAKVITRGGHDWTHRFPRIVAAAEALPISTAILDGEAVVLDEAGLSSFALLQQSLGGRGGKRIAREVILYAFDLLYLDGEDLRSKPLLERRRRLAAAIKIKGEGDIRLSEEIEGEGSAILRHACALGLEGIIAKRLAAPYRSGRGGEWLKIKCVQSESFVILGYEPSAAVAGGVGSLLLAARDKKGMRYVGSVGTGFTHKVARELRKALDAIPSTVPALQKRKAVVWARPELVAEVEFRGWTGDQLLRHAPFKGLREGADSAAVFDLDSSV